MWWHGITAISANTLMMISNIPEQVFRKSIEGPKKIAEANGSFREGNDEKAAYHPDVAQNYELTTDEHANNGIDIYKPFGENERYD